MGLWAGLDGCGNLAPIGIRSPDRPVSSESLYRLSYHGSLYYTSVFCTKFGCDHKGSTDVMFWETAGLYRGADKSLARPGMKQAIATGDFDFHISYL